MSKHLLKRQFNKGFTLMEMLIVVAIIAVLVAIAIPAISDKLTYSKQVADIANVRAMYKEALAQATVTQKETVRWVKTAMEADYDGKTVIEGLTINSWNDGQYVKITVDADENATLTAENTCGADVN